MKKYIKPSIIKLDINTERILDGSNTTQSVNINATQAEVDGDGYYKSRVWDMGSVDDEE